MASTSSEDSPAPKSTNQWNGLPHSFHSVLAIYPPIMIINRPINASTTLSVSLRSEPGANIQKIAGNALAIILKRLNMNAAEASDEYVLPNFPLEETGIDISVITAYVAISAQIAPPPIKRANVPVLSNMIATTRATN